MLVFKYEKKGAGVFISHLDALRAIDYTMRRAGLKIHYSQGFNPHAIMYFSPPIGIGIQSCAEYCVVSTDEKSEHFESEFNSVSPCWLKITDIFAVNSNPNLALIANCAVYSITFDNYAELRSELENYYNNNDILIIKRDKKKNLVEQSVKDKIHSVEFKQSEVVCKFHSGNSNLRADLFIGALLSGINAVAQNLSILKTNMLVDGKELDSFLSK